jgi:hypothetical protein
MTGMILVFPYINLRYLQDFMVVILMLLFKFITISLCCKLYVWNESVDFQYILWLIIIVVALRHGYVMMMEWTWDMYKMNCR